MIEILAEAFSQLRPNEGMTYNAGLPIDVSKIKYDNDSTLRISKEELDTKIAELQAEYEANEYQRQRAVAYPTWQDQLDKIYHEGIDAWKAEIQAIKDQYPKPDRA